LSLKKILVVGAGALGSWTTEILARSLKLDFTIVDFDKVDASNISRQLFYPSDIGKYKAEVLADRLRKLGSKTQPIVDKIENVIDTIGPFELALALTDNIESRTLVEEKFKTLHALVRPEVGMVLLTTERAKLSNIMRSGKHVGPQEIDMVVEVASIAARIAKEYLMTGKSKVEGKLIIISPYNIEFLSL